MSQLYVPDARLLPRALLHPNQSGRAHPAGPATRSSAREGDKTPHEHGQPPPGRDRQHGHVEALPPRLPDGAATGPYRGR